MKSLKLIIVFCTLTLTNQAQITGQSTYDHGGITSILSSGNYVGGSLPGFVMGGYRPSAASGTPNFFIDKVNSFGLFSGGFSKSFMLNTGGPFCTFPLVQEPNCYGVSVVGAASGNYALAGTFKSGCLVSLLNPNGGPLFSTFFAFPNGATSPTKPIIIESTTATGRFCVCGSYTSGSTRYMYAMRLLAGPTSFIIDWAYRYTLPYAATVFDPAAMVEDSYFNSSNGSEVAIVGAASVASGTNTGGFFMRMDATGTVSSPFKIINITNPVFSTELFASVAISNQNGGGFLVGGSTDRYQNATNTGMMFGLDPLGNVLWCSVYSGASNIVGIAERFSSTYNAYEFYAAGRSGVGMMVLKFNGTGGFFSQPGNPYTRFDYNVPGSTAVTAALSLVNSVSSGNNGIQVFGTTSNSSSGGDFLLNKAFFNGVTGTCASPSRQNLSTFNTYGIDYMEFATSYPIQLSGLLTCPNFNLSASNLSYTPVQPCNFTGLPTWPYSGNNNRSISTSINELTTNENNQLSIYPNPVSNITSISYNVVNEGIIKIQLYNNLGQIIKTLEEGSKSSGSYKFDLAMNDLGIENGMYFIKINQGNINMIQKIMYYRD